MDPAHALRRRSRPQPEDAGRPTGIYGASVDAPNKDGDTPLIIAAGIPSPGVVDALLKAGARVDARNIRGVTPLMHAASSNPNLEVLDLLIRAGARVNSRNYYYVTPLIYAVTSNQNPHVIERLLRAGADPETRDYDGLTALDYAMTSKSLGGTSAYRADGGVRGANPPRPPTSPLLRFFSAVLLLIMIRHHPGSETGWPKVHESRPRRRRSRPQACFEAFRILCQGVTVSKKHTKNFRTHSLATENPSIFFKVDNIRDDGLPFRL